MAKMIPAYIYSVSSLSSEIKSRLEELLPDQSFGGSHSSSKTYAKVSHVNVLNIISHVCGFKNYQSMRVNNQSFSVKNTVIESVEFRTKHLFSATTLQDSIAEMKDFIQQLRIDLLNGYLVLENHNKYFTLHLPDYVSDPKNKTHNHIDVTVDDIDNFIHLLKKHIDKTFSIDFSLGELSTIVGKHLLLNIEESDPVGYYKKLYDEFYEDVEVNDWFSPKRLYSSYDEDSKYFEDGEKVGLIELTFQMIAYQKACKLGFDFSDKDSVQYGDDTILVKK